MINQLVIGMYSLWGHVNLVIISYYSDVFFSQMEYMEDHIYTFWFSIYCLVVITE
jgi:hypothetical protein